MFERRRVVCKCSVEKCSFKVYVSLQIFAQSLQIRTLNSMHTCKDLVKNPKVIIGWIARKYNKKVTSDLKIVVGSLVDDIRIMYGVEIDP